jgi:uncharacterized membrane protein YraQ (UPF0718 family)
MEQFRIFSSIAAAIFLEAMPFLAFGALLSGAIEVLVPSDKLLRRIPGGLLPGISVGIASGVLLPVCECGVVPVVRRLARKGVPLNIAVAYMLSAPILNPVVLISTFVAFRGNLIMVAGRAAIAIIVAGTAGVIVWKMERSTKHESDHDDVKEARDHPKHEHVCTERKKSRKAIEILLHAGHDFLDMGKFLILGALAAAFFKTFLPQFVFDALSGNVILSVGGMMILAFLLSVCSEADAFVAASFAGLPAAAHLAFITYGPMLDLKLIGMYSATFSRRILLVLVVAPTILVFLLSIIHWLLIGG